jgi:hypothetical protein
VKSKNRGEGSKPLLQLRAHNDGNEPLLASRVCKGWAARDSPLLVAPCVALPLCLSPPLVVVHVLFHSSTHTQNSRHPQRQKKNGRNKTKRRTKRPQRPQTKPHKIENRKKKWTKKKQIQRKKNEEVTKKKMKKL